MRRPRPKRGERRIDAAIDLYGFAKPQIRKVINDLLQKTAAYISPQICKVINDLLQVAVAPLSQEFSLASEVTYNGYGLDEFVPQKTASYISQNDVHDGEMTVKEVLDFSARCQGVGQRYELLKELSKKARQHGIYPDPVHEGIIGLQG